jgi:type I restriction enzyme S subunit
MKKKFDEIFLDCTKQGTKIKTDEYQTAGRYQIIDQGQKDIAGFSDRETGVFADVPAIVFGDHTRIIKYVDKPFFLGADGVKVLRSKSNDTNYKYLYYALQAVRIPDTGYNRHFKWLKEAEIKLPERSAQEKIAKILDAINGVIEIRQEQLHVLEELVKLRFQEMFGDGNYPLVKTKDVCDFITKGTTPPTGKIYPDYNEDRVPYLKVYNLSFTGELLFNEEPQFIEKEVHNNKLSRSKVYPCDVLMNIVGPPLGKFSIVTDEYEEWNINQAIAIFRAKKMIEPRFMLAALMQPNVLQPFLNQAVGIRQLNLSLEQCRNLEIPLPPLDEQKRFTAFAEHISNLKFAVQKSIDETQLLFDSLMQKYFS